MEEYIIVSIPYLGIVYVAEIFQPKTDMLKWSSRRYGYCYPKKIQYINDRNGSNQQQMRLDVESKETMAVGLNWCIASTKVTLYTSIQCGQGRWEMTNNIIDLGF